MSGTGYSVPSDSYPVAVATEYDFGGYAINRASTSLTAAITSGTLSIPVLGPLNELPTSGIITIDDERIRYYDVDLLNTALLVQPTDRGFDGTVPAGHALNARVAFNVTAWRVNKLIKEVIAIQELLGANFTGAFPAQAKFVLQESILSLPAAQSLGVLTTGMVKNTTTSGVGVLSIGTPSTDYISPSVAATYSALQTFDAGIKLNDGDTITLGTSDQASLAYDAAADVALLTGRDFVADERLGLNSGTAFTVFFDHVATAERVITIPNTSGNMPVSVDEPLVITGTPEPGWTLTATSSFEAEFRNNRTFIISEKSANYTVQLSDLNSVIHADGTFTVTLPNFGMNNEFGFNVIVNNVGLGVITFTSTATIKAKGVLLESQYGVATCYWDGEEWYLVGDLS